MTLSLSIAEHYCAAAELGVDEQARDAAKIALADALAVMVAATGLEPATKPFLAYAQAFGPGPSTLIGQGAKVAPQFAALANGALAHAIDFEDTFEEGMVHPNASLIPAVLALAESEGAAGGDVLNALALGCDFSCRVSLALASDPAKRGWYHPPVLAGLGATLGATLLLKLDAHAIRNALGLFSLQFMLGDELKRSPQSDLRAVREGFAARAAVEAALLARAGVEAVAAPLEGLSGLFAMLTGAPPREDAFATIGKTFYGSEVGVKRWPACRGTHNAIVAADAFRHAGIKPEHVASVSVQVGPPNDMLFVPREQRIAPQTAIDGKFSIPFVFATALRTGDVSLASFAVDKLHDDEVLALAAKVEMASEPAPRGVEAIYQVETHAGQTLTETVTSVPVWRTKEITLASLTPKLETCLALGQKTVAPHQFAAALVGVENDGISELMRLV